MICKHLESTHRHRIEELLHTDRIIKAFHKKKKWINLRAQMEDEHRKVMLRKFDEDLRISFQEWVERQKLKEAQELCKEKERKLEEAVKQPGGKGKERKSKNKRRKKSMFSFSVYKHIELS